MRDLYHFYHAYVAEDPDVWVPVVHVWRSVPPLKDPTFDAVPLHAAERFEWKGPVL